MRGTMNLDVISIVGMARIGKSAIARKMYNSNMSHGIASGLKLSQGKC